MGSNYMPDDVKNGVPRYSFELTRSEAANGCVKRISVQGSVYTVPVPAGTKKGDRFEIYSKNGMVIGTAEVTAISGGDAGNSPGGASRGTAGRKVAIIAIVLALAVAALIYVLTRPAKNVDPVPGDDTTVVPDDEETGDSGTQPAGELTDQMENELITFCTSFAFCGIERDHMLGLTSYDCENSESFGVLQAIMRDYLTFSSEYYSEICPYNLDFEYVDLDGSNMDPLCKGEFSIGYYTANADAINWIAYNVFNVTEDGLERELEFSSRLTEPEDFFCPLYLHDGKYYLLPETGGGPGIHIRIHSADYDPETDIYTVEYEEGETWTSDEVDWSGIHKIARMQYKTEGGKGYWSLYDAYNQEEDFE